MRRVRVTADRQDLELKLPGVYAQVQGPRWVEEPGMPENELPVESAKVERVRELAVGWDEGKRPPASAKDAWSATEWVLYLQDLPRTLPEDECRWLDDNFDLTSQGNSEILCNWLIIAAGSGLIPAH